MVLIGVLIDQNYKSASLSRPHLRPAMENVSIYKSIVVLGGAPVPRSRPGSKQYLITGNDCLNLVPARPGNTHIHFIGVSGQGTGEGYCCNQVVTSSPELVVCQYLCLFFMSGVWPQGPH